MSPYFERKKDARKVLDSRSLVTVFVIKFDKKHSRRFVTINESHSIHRFSCIYYLLMPAFLFGFLYGIFCMPNDFSDLILDDRFTGV